MKKFEVYGKSYKKAYRRHCARKKLKLRARKWEGMFSMDYQPFQFSRVASWGEIWQKIEKGELACWLRTTGKPCSCECCSPSFKREKREKIKKYIYNTIFEDNETEGLTHVTKL